MTKPGYGFQRFTLSKEQGQSLVEFTLAMPVLLLVLVGILDLGRVYYAYFTISNASREGARFASLSPYTDSDIQDAAVAEAANSIFTLSRSDVTVSRENGNVEGSAITVTVTKQFPLVTTYIIGAVTIPIRASTEMAIIVGDPPS